MKKMIFLGWLSTIIVCLSFMGFVAFMVIAIFKNSFFLAIYSLGMGYLGYCLLALTMEEIDE